jgi:hypothetical protein
MSVTTRVVSAVAVLALLLTAAGPVAAGSAEAARITARSSADVMAPGEQFSLRGRFTIGDRPAGNHVVKVQSGYIGAWTTLDGARVRTRPDGRFRVRVVLCVKGVRDLRVVGVVPGPRDEAFDRVTVMVKRGS